MSEKLLGGIYTAEEREKIPVNCMNLQHQYFKFIWGELPLAPNEVTGLKTAINESREKLGMESLKFKLGESSNDK